jgi:hypothetical protein
MPSFVINIDVPDLTAGIEFSGRTGSFSATRS